MTMYDPDNETHLNQLHQHKVATAHLRRGTYRFEGGSFHNTQQNLREPMQFVHMFPPLPMPVPGSWDPNHPSAADMAVSPEVYERVRRTDQPSGVEVVVYVYRPPHEASKPLE